MKSFNKTPANNNAKLIIQQALHWFNRFIFRECPNYMISENAAKGNADEK